MKCTYCCPFHPLQLPVARLLTFYFPPSSGQRPKKTLLQKLPGKKPTRSLYWFLVVYRPALSWRQSPLQRLNFTRRTGFFEYSVSGAPIAFRNHDWTLHSWEQHTPSRDVTLYSLQSFTPSQPSFSPIINGWTKH